MNNILFSSLIMHRSWPDENFSGGALVPVLLFGKFFYRSPTENINLNLFQSFEITIKILVISPWLLCQQLKHIPFLDQNFVVLECF